MDPFTLALLASLGVGAATEVLPAVFPGRAEKERRARLKELLEREEQGRLGLTDEERVSIEQRALRPARSMAAEARSRAGAGLGLSPHTDVSDLARLREAEQKAVTGAGMQAGLQISAADLARKREEQRELEARLAQSAAVQQQTMEGIQGIAGQAAALAPEMSMLRQMGLTGTPATIGDPAEFTNQLRASGFEDRHIQQIRALGDRYGDSFWDVLADTVEGGPLADEELAMILRHYAAGGM